MMKIEKYMVSLVCILMLASTGVGMLMSTYAIIELGGLIFLAAAVLLTAGAIGHYRFACDHKRIRREYREAWIRALHDRPFEKGWQFTGDVGVLIE